MCRAISSKEFRKKIEEAEQGRPAGIINEYLNVTGYVLSNSHGKVELPEDFDEKLKFITAKVELGDVVWAHGAGLYLIIDKHPKVNDDGHHFRGIKVSPSLTGSFELIVDQRSAVLADIGCLRVKHTSFDISRISDLCFERFKAFTRVVEINDELKLMKELYNA